MLKELCAALGRVFDTEVGEEEFSDLQNAYGLLLSVSKLNTAEAPQQVRIYFKGFSPFLNLLSS